LQYLGLVLGDLLYLEESETDSGTAGPFVQPSTSLGTSHSRRRHSYHLTGNMEVLMLRAILYSHDIACNRKAVPQMLRLAR
jgi:hypothetical protein